MSEITKQAAQRAAMLLTASIKTVLLYPQAHPAVRQPLQELVEILTGMLGDKKELHLGVVEGAFFIESCLLVSANAVVGELVERLTQKEVSALTIYPGLSPDDLFNFASLLANRQTTIDSLPGEMERKGIRSIRLGIDQAASDGSSDGGETVAPAAIYRDALKAVQETMREIDSGRIPSGEWINEVVDNGRQPGAARYQRDRPGAEAKPDGERGAGREDRNGCRRRDAGHPQGA